MTKIDRDTTLTNGGTVGSLLDQLRAKRAEAVGAMQRTPRSQKTLSEYHLAAGRLQGVVLALLLLGMSEEEIDRY